MINLENEGVITAQGSQMITRNIIEDRKSNIWIAELIIN